MMIYWDSLFLLNLIKYAATISPTSIEIIIKNMPSSLTEPLGKIANNVADRNSNKVNH